MKLSRDTVKKAYIEFGERFDWPPHAKTDEQKSRIIDLDWRELSKQYSDETFRDALTVAWQQARRFPVLADFHRGFDAPESNEVDMNGYKI